MVQMVNKKVVCLILVKFNKSFTSTFIKNDDL